MTELLSIPTVVPPSTLTDADFATAAASLGCEIATIKAVAHVETGVRGAFQRDGRPTILFERHVFSRLTNHNFDGQAPDISNPVPGGYGSFDSQYDRITKALALNANDALEAASWGAFQIMGENYRAAGFADVQSMVAAMRISVGAHLTAFVSFIRSGRNLPAAIQVKDWNAIAFNYNGPGYARNDYAGKLAAAYAQFS